MQAGQNEAARAAFDAAVAQAPDRAAPLVHRATLLQLLGEFDAAERDLRQAARLEPGNGAFWRIAAVARKLAPGDPLIAEMEALDAGDLSDESRRQLSYALAKAMEDSGAHERVFFYLDRANALTRRRWPYDLRADIAAARRICRSYERRGAAEGHRGPPRPIFVTGLPRSGTTLVEQILASHPEVEGAGETGWLSPHLSRAVEALDAGGGPVDWAEAGRAWAAEAAARFPQAAHVTDKSISTAFYAGFVLAALPEARIVVVRRDPRDTCLSIYRNMFPDGSHRYATDLADLGRYARLSAEMTGFWRARLPAAAFLEVEYEALTAAPEAETRRLLDFCGLSWDPACLDFHANTRRVDTLSLYQVRQPIYRSSVRGWKRYEAELQPLLDALAETGPLL
jgi:tetratricopeptide (TPR) repeat protein